MQLIYTHENKILVENAKNAVEQAGVHTVLRNEYTAGGIGELPPLETWPELWVQEEDAERAKQIVDVFMTQADGEPWVCAQCNETNEASFEVCWQCQSACPM